MMLKFKFNKLVRDKIVEQQLANGAEPKYHRLEPEAHARELAAKIVEEAREIPTEGMQEIAAEIADVQQAIDDLKALHGLSDADVAKAQAAKLAKNGGFGDGLFVSYVEVAEDNAWVEYYRKNKRRYPEID